MNTKKEGQLKASLQFVSDAHKEWNQPEKRLAEIEKFADEILAKPDKYENRRGKKSVWLTDEQILALKIREYARTMRVNMEQGDIHKLAMAGINLAHAMYDYHKKFVALKQKKDAANHRHRGTKAKKEEYKKEAIRNLKESIEKNENSKTAWTHMDYLQNLKKKEKFKNVPKTWQEELRVEFIDQLFEMRRKDLVRGIKQR